jgi:hypothetical protein
VLGSTVDTGWAVNSDGAGGLLLNVLGTPTGPSHLIIGPPGATGYTNANGSIAGNKPHNPFLNQTATFLLDVAGVAPSTTVTSATFSFGTTAGNDVPGTKTVPEPSSLTLLLTAAVGGMALVLRKRLGGLSIRVSSRSSARLRESTENSILRFAVVDPRKV